MRTSVYVIVAAIGFAAHPALAQPNRTAATIWKGVQAACNATAAKPPTELGQRIARTAIEDFTRFGGHMIDFGRAAVPLRPDGGRTRRG